MGEYFDEYAGGEPSADAGSFDEPSQVDSSAGAILPGEDMIPFDISSTVESGAGILARAAGNAFGGPNMLPATFKGLRIGGPNGLEAGSDTGGGGAPGLMPITPGGAIWKGIIAKVSAHLGRQATHATVRYLLNRFGAGAANALGLSEDEVLFVFGFGKRRKGHRRGPGLYTIAKRIRQAQRMQKTVQRVLGAHIGRAVHHKAHHFGRRRKRR